MQTPGAATSNDDRTLGLSLSGGAAFGAAHVGVLLELEARGIRPGLAVGTSSGAMVAAAYAAGFDAQQIERAVLDFRWRDIADWSFAPRLGLLDSNAITVGIHRALGFDPLIEELPRGFGAVATDLRTRRAVTIDRGPLSTALRSTIAVPGLLSPVRRDGAWLADGGMVDNVPVEATREIGAERVIVVRLHAKFENVRMMRTVSRTADLVSDPSVVLIQPEMERMAQWRMVDAARLIAEGRRAAASALDAADARALAPAVPAAASHG